MMCVGNLPNGLPRDASQYFGDQIMKYVFEPLLEPGNEMITKATITQNGQLTPLFQYLEDYAKGS
jgi:hypothetical protein